MSQFQCRARCSGSLTPFQSSWGVVDHYLFVDATGAEYRLYDPGNSGQWTSNQSSRVTYDSKANKLYFYDGSFWYMGCISGGTEADIGTLYPTQMEDSNGNFITISYKAGGGLTWPNSSARIDQIIDVRGYPYTPVNPTYAFNYDANSGELLSITQGIATNVAFSGANFLHFSTSIQNITAPTGSGLSFGNTNVLNSVTQASVYTTQFTYDTGAELAQVTFPTGGHLRYDYRTWNYLGSASGQVRSYREVSNRYLSMNSDGTTNGHTHSDGIAIRTMARWAFTNGAHWPTQPTTVRSIRALRSGFSMQAPARRPGSLG